MLNDGRTYTSIILTIFRDSSKLAKLLSYLIYNTVNFE